MIGGWVIENVPVMYEDEHGVAEVRRLWLVNTLMDECAVYVDGAQGTRIGLRDYVFWERSRTYCNSARRRDASREVRMIGFPFDPCEGRTLAQIV
jgi:hypothetical protein